jgi:hypothetical protein
MLRVGPAGRDRLAPTTSVWTRQLVRPRAISRGSWASSPRAVRSESRAAFATRRDCGAFIRPIPPWAFSSLRSSERQHWAPLPAPAARGFCGRVRRDVRNQRHEGFFATAAGSSSLTPPALQRTLADA